MTPDDAAEIVSEHIVKGRIVQRLLHSEGGRRREGDQPLETKFYKNQFRIALRNCGVINPENIDEYIGTGGYEALGRALTQQTRSRSSTPSWPPGSGAAAARASPPAQVAVDTRRGEPRRGESSSAATPTRAIRARSWTGSVLEGDPHSVIEAMTIAGYAIGAHQGYIYVRAEYPIAVHRLQVAIGQAKEYGLLGRTSSTPASASTWSCAWAPAPSSAARRPPL